MYPGQCRVRTSANHSAVCLLCELSLDGLLTVHNGCLVGHLFWPVLRARYSRRDRNKHNILVDNYFPMELPWCCSLLATRLGISFNPRPPPSAIFDCTYNIALLSLLLFVIPGWD